MELETMWGRLVELLICFGLRTVGVDGAIYLCDSRAKKTCSPTMSTKYAILLMIPFGLKDLGHLIVVTCYPLIEIVQMLSRVLILWTLLIV